MGFIAVHVAIITLQVKCPVMNARSYPLLMEGLLDLVTADAQIIKIEQQRIEMTGVARVRLFRRRKEYWQIGESRIIALPNLAAPYQIVLHAAQLAKSQRELHHFVRHYLCVPYNLSFFFAINC